jgi:hypothetical protein
MIGKRIFVKIDGKIPLIPYICYAVDDGYEYYRCIIEQRPNVRISTGIDKTIVSVTPTKKKNETKRSYDLYIL